MEKDENNNGWLINPTFQDGIELARELIYQSILKTELTKDDPLFKNIMDRINEYLNQVTNAHMEKRITTLIDQFDLTLDK